MNELIEQLITAFKNETIYKEYIEAKDQLDKYSELLYSYKQTKEEYMKMRPYFQYQDFSELKERFENLSSQVSQLEAYRRYLIVSHQLQDRLDELTDIIFKGVLIEAEDVVCVSSQENIKEEI